MKKKQNHQIYQVEQNKTLTKIDIKIGAEDMIYVIILGSIVILIALFVGSYKIMRKHPKTLLTDIE